MGCLQRSALVLYVSSLS